MESQCTKIRDKLFTVAKCLHWSLTAAAVFGFVGWHYYTYVFKLCLQTIKNPYQRTIYLVIVNVLSVMIVWCFLMTSLTPPGKIPQEFHVDRDDATDILQGYYNEAGRQKFLHSLARRLPIVTRTFSGGIAYCARCQVIKPDRAHHCSTCSRCILKMDHHCYCVNNCISFTNYKFFFLFVLYYFLYSAFVSATTLRPFVSYWKEDDPSWDDFQFLLLFLLSNIIALNMAGFIVFHTFLMSTNRTTLEIFRPPVLVATGLDRRAFNLGYLKNFYEVFGDRWYLWLIPVSSGKGDGIHFELRRRDEESEPLLTRGPDRPNVEARHPTGSS
ncbi:palmitoyltransferase ZDHHC2-like [Ornithodoros turicata]|uniref:palmitoyltransferase ZDHHC2-like n=1 Tax=Ornithodoros turicata TaxID=34597 RepID=UPI003139CCEE